MEAQKNGKPGASKENPGLMEAKCNFWVDGTIEKLKA